MQAGDQGQKVNENMTDTAIAYRMRSRANASVAPGSSPDLGLDPQTFLSSLLPRSHAAVCIDVKHSVVSLVTERARRVHARPNLVTAARQGNVTLTRAIQIRARLAESPDEIAAAIHLIRRRYAWRGYDMPAEEQDAVEEAFAPDSRQLVFVATDEGRTVGTITLGLDRRSGLLAEASYADAIQGQRASGEQVCEVTRLAVAEDVESKPVLAALFSLTWAAASINGVTQMFVEVNPRHVVFYKRVLGFTIAAEERFCERVNAPSVLLRVDMADLERRLITMNAKVAGLAAQAQAAA